MNTKILQRVFREDPEMAAEILEFIEGGDPGVDDLRRTEIAHVLLRAGASMYDLFILLKIPTDYNNRAVVAAYYGFEPGAEEYFLSLDVAKAYLMDGGQYRLDLEARNRNNFKSGNIYARFYVASAESMEVVDVVGTFIETTVVNETCLDGEYLYLVRARSDEDRNEVKEIDNRYVYGIVRIRDDKSVDWIVHPNEELTGPSLELGMDRLKGAISDATT